MTGTATRVLSQMLLILILMMVAMSLKDTSKCRANDTSRNDTNIIVFQDDLKMEFQMDSESNQKVLASTKHKTSATEDPNKPLVQAMQCPSFGNTNCHTQNLGTDRSVIL